MWICPKVKDTQSSWLAFPSLATFGPGPFLTAGQRCLARPEPANTIGPRTPVHRGINHRFLEYFTSLRFRVRVIIVISFRSCINVPSAKIPIPREAEFHTSYHHHSKDSISAVKESVPKWPS